MATIADKARRMDDCSCELCIEESVTESVQYYTVRSKFTVSTLTCLDNLAVRDDCDCDVKSCVVRPRHFVFVVDGSDSFNRSLPNGQTWFDEVKKFIEEFLSNANFDKRSAPSIVSVYQFSGLKQHVADYKPGTGGKVDRGANDPKPDYHYRCEINMEYFNATSLTKKMNMIKSIQNMDALEGNGQLCLALQDLSLPSFIEKSEQSMGAAPAGTNPADWVPERVLIVITDSQWDLNGLKDASGNPATEATIVANTRNAYDRVYSASGDIVLSARMQSPAYLMNQLSKPAERATLFTSETIEKNFAAFRQKIFDDMNLH